MALRPLLIWPDPKLREPSRATTGADRPLVMAAFQDLVDTIKIYRGASLSGVQIGHKIRVIALDAGEGVECYQNPRIVSVEGRAAPRVDSCLSLPGVTECALRHPIVVVEAENIDGRLVTIRAEGFRAQALQHEIEHLDGVCFLDSLPPYIKDRAIERIRRSKLRSKK